MNVPSYHIETHTDHNIGHHTKNLSLLEDIKTNTANIKVSTDSVNLNVDTLEALIATTNTNTNNINTNTISVGSKIDTNKADITSKLQDIRTDHSTAHTKLDTVATKLDTVNTTLTAGGVVDITTLAKSAKQDLLKTAIEANTTALNSTLGDLATESTLQIISEFVCDTSDTTISSSALPSGASTAILQTNGTQQTKIMGIGDDGQNKQVKTDNSGNLSAYLVSDVVMKPSNITNGDHASFSGSSVASMLRGRLNINDNTTGIFLKCDLGGALSVNSTNADLTNGNALVKTKINQVWDTPSNVHSSLESPANNSNPHGLGNGVIATSSTLINPNQLTTFRVKNLSARTDFNLYQQWSFDNSNWEEMENDLNPSLNAKSTVLITPTSPNLIGIRLPYFRFVIKNNHISAVNFELKKIMSV